MDLRSTISRRINAVRLAYAVIGVLGLLSGATNTFAEQPLPDPELTLENCVLAEFEIPPERNFLIVPVKLEGKTYQFAVCTGMSGSVVDPQLLHGHFRPNNLDEKNRLAEDREESPRSKIIRWRTPELQIGRGNIPLGLDCRVIDLTEYRKSTGTEISGIFGTDIFNHFALQLNWDQGRLKLLRPRSAAFVVKADPVTPWRSETCYLQSGPAITQVDLPCIGHTRVMVDTGFSGELALESQKFDELILLGECSREARIAVIFAPGGEISIPGGQVPFLHFGNAMPWQLAVVKSDQCRVGLKFLSRFNLILDQGGELWYTESKTWNKVRPPNRSGLSVAREAGNVVVQGVDDNSVAAFQGIKSGDVLLDLDGTRLSPNSLNVVREALSTPGREVLFKVRRGVQEMQVKLFVPEDSEPDWRALSQSAATARTAWSKRRIGGPLMDRIQLELSRNPASARNLKAAVAGIKFSQQRLSAVEHVTIPERFEQLVGLYGNQTRRFGDADLPLLFSVTAFTKDCETAVCFLVLESGLVGWHAVEGSLYRTSRLGTFGPESLGQLRRCLQELPPGPVVLPAEDRQLALSSLHAGEWGTRFYDRARLPHAVIEIIRTVHPHSRFGAWVPTRVADLNLTTDKIGTQEIAISPDGRTIASVQGPGARIWDFDGRQLTEKGAPILGLTGFGLAFSPDGRFLAVGKRHGIGIVETADWNTVAEIKTTVKEPTPARLQFTADGKFLLDCVEPLRAHDTSTWEGNPEFAGIPAGAKWHAVSASNAHAVISRARKSLWIWNRTTNQSVKQIEEKCELIAAAFSPDQTLVAILTASEPDWKDIAETDVRLRIFRTATGETVTELHPYEMLWMTPGAGLLWTSDGKYLIGASRPEMSSRTSRLHLWNVRTGRHCADFTGTPAIERGIGIAMKGKWLIAGSQDWKIECWDLERQLAAVSAVEESFNVLPPPAEMQKGSTDD